MTGTLNYIGCILNCRNSMETRWRSGDRQQPAAPLLGRPTNSENYIHHLQRFNFNRSCILLLFLPGRRNLDCTHYSSVYLNPKNPLAP